MNCFKFLLVSAYSLVLAGSAFAADPLKPETLPTGQKTYVIEREMPGLGKMSAADLKAAAQKSCKVLHDLGPKIQWVQSYVTGDKMYCIYLAPDADIVREHAKEGGFPAKQRPPR